MSSTSNLEKSIFANSVINLVANRKIKSYQIGADEIPSDFGRYGTPKLFQAPQFVSLGKPSGTTPINTCVCFITPTRLESNNLLEVVLS